MSISDKDIELRNWAEELAGQTTVEGVSSAVARHILRILPERHFEEVDPTWGTGPSPSRLALLKDFRIAILCVVLSVSSDSRPSRAYMHDLFEIAFEDRQQLWRHEAALNSDLEVSKKLPNAFAIFKQPLITFAQNVDFWEIEGEGISRIDDTTLKQFIVFLSQQSVWSFWRDWYQGFLDGNPLDWELQRRVALIDDVIWDAGPEAVAEEIERIKVEFEAQLPKQPRFPAYEPDDLRPLIQNRIIATASLQGLAVQISGAIEQYHADTGANALPEALAPLQDMPALMNAIADRLGGIQQPDNISPETEQDLRAEIGRLNAKVAELENRLSALSAEIESLSRSEKGKVFSLLRNTALLGGLVSGLWAMSGDELGARARYENIITYTNDIRALLMKEGLPQTQVETSLRPRTRPDDGA